LEKNIGNNYYAPIWIMVETIKEQKKILDKQGEFLVQKGEVEMLNGSYWFECACHSAEDTLNFALHKGEDKEIYLTIFLDNGTLLKRLWLGLKYIFGYKCKYGHFNCWTMKEEDVGRLKKMIEDFENLGRRQ